MVSICNRSCNKCNLQLHCQGCSFCEVSLCKNDCFQCFSLCPKRGGSFAYLKKLGGGEVTLKTNKKYDLPDHIPILPDHLTEPLIVNDVVGIHSGNMFANNGESITKGYLDRGLQGALNTKNEIEGVLEFYVRDRTLEGFWDNRHMVYEQLKRLKWRVVLAPNFSVYEDAPRIDHLYNMKRSSIVYNELIEQDLPAVPDISWYNQIDLDQWIREIKKNQLKTIAFSFQVVDVRLKASNLWKHYLMGFKYLCQRISKEVEIIVTGVVSPNRLAAVKAAAGERKLFVLNQTAYVQSRRGWLSSKMEKAPESMTKNDILLANIEYYNEQYKRMNKLGE